MKYRTLGKTGLDVSCLSFGASSLGSVFRQVRESEGVRTVHAALDLGINFFDVSPFYGLTAAETLLGKALKGVPRDRYLLATKVGRYGEEVFDFSADRVRAGVEESLRRLQVDHGDVIQCLDIEFANLDRVIEETLPALRAVQDQGKARFVGITGLPLKIFEYVLDRAEVDTVLSYCHYALNDTSLSSMIPFLEEKGVGIINASPLSMGLLTNRGTPDWHPASPTLKEVCARAAEFCRARGVDIARAAIQFTLSNPRIHTTLVGTADPENIRKNAAWLDEPPDEELAEEIKEILKPVQDWTWLMGRPENNGDLRGYRAKYPAD